MSKYDKTIAISHEEEGSYHRREVEPGSHQHTTTSKPVTTYHTERYLVEDDDCKPLARYKASSDRKSALAGQYTSDEDDKDNYEEWTTSKRKVNHKTRQVETRVSRQLLVENGKVIADSGPQVTTRIKEDNKVEECEKEKTPKNKSKFEALENAPEGPEGTVSGRVLGEKKEIQRVKRQVREENMQYHDERFQELTGKDVHRRAIKAPHELITINDDKHHSSNSAPRGKMVHYSNRGKKYEDTNEILEVAKLAIDGSITKEVKRTHYHEESSEDEKPDETGEAEELRRKPIVQRSSRRTADYVNDFDDLRTPEANENDEHEEYNSHGNQAITSRPSSSLLSSARRHHHHHQPTSTSAGSSSRRHKAKNVEEDDPAFPRYDLDPLLDSLQDRASNNDGLHTSRQPSKSYSRNVVPAGHETSSDEDGVSQRHYGTGPRHHSSSHFGSSQTVEIPEEYRVNKQRLMASKSSPSPSGGRASAQQRHQGRNYRREDAATQAHLTDEEIERQSIRSSLSSISGGGRAHAKAAQHLQRQSTPNSSRRYYYGTQAHSNGSAIGKSASQVEQKKAKRRNSLTSSSSASSSSDSLANQHRATNTQAKQREGAHSRDSGFKSPQTQEARTVSPSLSDQKRREQQIYSVSSKSKQHNNKFRDYDGVASPAPTSGSVGQRSVKTTTTTLSAGLAERPGSRAKEAEGKKKREDKRLSKATRQDERVAGTEPQAESGFDNDAFEFDQIDGNKTFTRRQRTQSSDTISVSSLNGPNATKIKVPYRHLIEIQQSHKSEAELVSETESNSKSKKSLDKFAVEKSSSEMSFKEDIEKLSRRLANISRGLQDPQAQRQQGQYNYKTVVANIQSAPTKQHQIINAYHVKLEQNSPFHQLPVSAVDHVVENNNNQQTDFNLNEYFVNYRAIPALVDESALLTGKYDEIYNDLEDDQASSCSMQSSKTYKVCTIPTEATTPAMEANGFDLTSETKEDKKRKSFEDCDELGVSEQEIAEFDVNGNNKRPAAWIFDPQDGSSTAIVPPERPKDPEKPKMEPKTEELVQSRGGRSYYLELIEQQGKNQDNDTSKLQRPSSIDSLYARWNSHGALNKKACPAKPSTPSQLNRNSFKSSQNIYKSTKELNSTIARHEQTSSRANNMLKKNLRRQLPFNGLPPSLGDKSRSSSCLLSVTKPSKYSIYGGFKKPDETSKPVPRLSYSRAIGPRSQRQLENQPKIPSRYLKMK